MRPGPAGGSRRALRRAAPKAGDWVIVVVRGEKAMSYLPRPGAKPLAFTNPVWVK